ncbi:TolC family protein [Blastomonas sp. AAP53]|uniref:TolC family protein n=1 Tax=Blastomonas sp. AAP53 TaxID=1248760 RepID=UPI0002FE6964|nr:TolC family protein [Blastomonas sp. AAP53]
MRKALLLAGLAASTLAALAAPAGAQSLPAPLTVPDQVRSAQGLQLSEVLESSRRFAPAILEALAMARAADGRVLASEGAFDLLFTGEGFSRVAGFYDGTYLQGKAIQPLTNNGGQLEASYRVSRGDFPTYEDYSFTDRLGELKVRGVFALLRDRYIDDRRFGQQSALIERDMAGLDALIIAIGVQQRAIQAYGQWVAAGQQVQVYRSLVGLAQDRQQGIRRQVQLGARAAILLTENEQNLLRRQSLLVAAERDLANAAQRLSLFWRDDDGRPRVATPAQLPSALPMISAARETDPAAILARRPDIKLIEQRLELGETRLELERNRLLPSLRLFAEAGKDFGEEGLGGRSRDPFEAIVGFTFSMPLQNRAAKGQVAATEANINALEWRRRQSEEQIIAEVEQLSTNLTAAERLAVLARDEEVQAEKLAAGERRLFQAGASDFFLVNLREDAAANAAIRRLDAEFRLAQARADLVAVAADLDALRLSADFGQVPAP